MIERVSRYYDGPLAQVKDKYIDQYNISVYRNFVTNKQVSYIEYTWKQGDSLSLVAEMYGIQSKYWWEIMDINPEISDPFLIQPGTIVRVPYGQ